jgi:hypothetical protein
VEWLIDKRGNTRLSTTTGSISVLYDGSGVIVYDYNNGTSEIYTSDLVQIQPGTEYGECIDVAYIGGGWFSGSCYASVRHGIDGGATADGFIGRVLFSKDEEHLFKDVSNIYRVDGEYVFYDGGDGRTGVMTFDGVAVIQTESDEYVGVVTDGGSAEAFMINANTPFTPFFGKTENPVHRAYRLVGIDGEVIASGDGILSYDEAAGLYSVLAEDAYRYLGKNGAVVISIPLMSYMMD